MIQCERPEWHKTCPNSNRGDGTPDAGHRLTQRMSAATCWPLSWLSRPQIHKVTPGRPSSAPPSRPTHSQLPCASLLFHPGVVQRRRHRSRMVIPAFHRALLLGNADPRQQGQNHAQHVYLGDRVERDGGGRVGQEDVEARKDEGKETARQSRSPISPVRGGDSRWLLTL